MTQVVEKLPSKHKALSSTSVPIKKGKIKKKRKGKTIHEIINFKTKWRTKTEILNKMVAE
jgi:hypothetical protein